MNLSGDEAFYYKRENDTHVDNFLIAGRQEFIESITDKIKSSLTVSKIEDDTFRFTGIDIKRTSKGITISRED